MVYLEDDQFLLLKRAAALSKKKMPEIVREALSNYLKRKHTTKIDYLSFVGIAEGPKKGRASEQVDEILKETLK